jgi:tellurite methyltransferase
MPTGASEWNAKHIAAAEGPAAEPAGFVVELLPLLPLGPTLDLACGTGRHTLLLAGRQQAVTAIDSSSVALEILEQRARASGLGIDRVQRADHAGDRQRAIQIWEADLERVSLPPESFSLVLCVNYLQRSLFSQMEGALVLGGVLLFETYTMAQLDLLVGRAIASTCWNPESCGRHFPGCAICFTANCGLGRELRA